MNRWGRLQDVVTALLVLGVLAAEGTLWVENPMHIPAGFLPARAFGLEAFKQVDSSMKPTISPGQYVLVSSWSYWGHQPRAGDLVVFQYSRDASLGDLKRVIAVMGSTVEIKEGVTYVDGRPEGHWRSLAAPSALLATAWVWHVLVTAWWFNDCSGSLTSRNPEASHG